MIEKDVIVAIMFIVILFLITLCYGFLFELCTFFPNGDPFDLNNVRIIVNNAFMIVLVIFLIVILIAILCIILECNGNYNVFDGVRYDVVGFFNVGW